jgi:eukaryotic-like serine/threonine-protein kinase
MPSESVVGFLDQAQASRVLFPEQVEQLIRQPDMPQSDLSSFCEFLLSRGVLTRFQASAIREARGQELSFAGYPVIDELGPCPGGTAYKALHPSLRTPLLLRRISFDWLAPADNPTDFIARAKAFGMLTHPNIVHLLDVGIYRDELFAVIEQPLDATDLETMAKEIGGAMPGFLAAEYCRAIASTLRLAHERGGTHGDVQPANLLVGPLSVKTLPDGQLRRRPAPDAVVRLAELGLVPRRPAAITDLKNLSPYLSPERVDSGVCNPSGDIYGLGATLYFLLAGRAPFSADSPSELAAKIRVTFTPSLAALRPDLPAELVALVGKMMDKQPESRPATAADVEAALSKFCRPGTVPAQPAAIPMVAPATDVPVLYPVGQLAPADVEHAAAAEPDAWGIGNMSLAHAHSHAETAPRKREMSAYDKGKARRMLILGGLLHLTWITLALLWAFGAFDSPSDPDPTDKPDKPSKKDDTPKKNKKQKAG